MAEVCGDALRAFAAAIDGAVKAAIEKEARDTAERARRLCPVRSGRLRSSIIAEGDTVRAGADYALCVEEGARGRPAQPFMKPATDIGALRDGVAAAIDAARASS